MLTPRNSQHHLPNTGSHRKERQLLAEVWRRSDTIEQAPVTHDLSTHDGGLEAEAGGEGHTGPEQVMLYLFVSLLIGAFVRKALLEVKKRLGVRLPYSVVLLVVGGLLGYAEFEANRKDSGDQMIASMRSWSNIGQVPHLLLFIFLPALLYEACMTTDYFVFSNHLSSSLLLAGPGMAVQVVLIAVTARYMLPFGWQWTESFLLGGILSATDPVAVIGLLKELGVLPDLRVLIEGESVLNDGTAIVVYELCLAVLVEPNATVAEHTASGFSFAGNLMGQDLRAHRDAFWHETKDDTLRLVLGGPALGVAAFAVSYVWLSSIADPFEQTIVTVCGAYLTYFVAEGTDVGVSAVLSIVTLGVLMAGYGRTSLSEEAEHVIHGFWGVLVFCSDTIVFVLAGTIIVDQAFLSETAIFGASDWGYLFLLYLVLMLIRGFMVLLIAFYLRQYGYGLDYKVCSLGDFIKSMFVITWGGLRGAVGLVLALAVSANDEVREVTARHGDPLYADRCLVFVAGIVVLTLLINATTLEFIIKAMGLGNPTSADIKVYQGAQTYLEKTRKRKIDELQHWTLFPELAQARWQNIMEQTKIVSAHAKLSHQASQSFKEETSFFGESHMEEPSNSKIADAYHRRFLLSLKASYANQFSHGIIRARPYRLLLWAVNKALLQMSDRTSKDASMLKFEWEWLSRSNMLSFGTVGEYVMRHRGFGMSWVMMIMNDRVKDQIQIASAVAKAHFEASHVDEGGAAVPYAYDTVIEQSKTVRMLAQIHLSFLETEYPDVAAQNSTEMAVGLVSLALKEEVESLAQLGQLTGTEREHLLDHIKENVHRCAKLHVTLGIEIWERVYNLPLFNYIDDQDFQLTWSELNLEPTTYKIDEVIEKEGEENDGIWVLLSGLVFLCKDSPKRGSEVQKQVMQHSVQAGSEIGTIEFMAKDAGYPSRNLHSIVATTEVTLIKITSEKMQQIFTAHPVVRQRMWQLYGRDFLLNFTYLFDTPIFISPDIHFSTAVLRRPMQDSTVKHEIPALLIAGTIKRASGELIKGVSMVDPDSNNPSIQFVSATNLLLLFPPEEESKHFADAAVKMLGPKSNLAAQRASLELTRADRSRSFVDNTGIASPAFAGRGSEGGLVSVSSITVERSKFRISSMELARRQLRPSVDVQRLCEAYREDAVTAAKSEPKTTLLAAAPTGGVAEAGVAAARHTAERGDDSSDHADSEDGGLHLSLSRRNAPDSQTGVV